MTLKWMCFVLAVALFGYATATAVPDGVLTNASDVQQSPKLTCPVGFTFFEGGVCLNISRDYLNGLPSLTPEEARSKCVAMSDDDWTLDLAYPIDEYLLMQINDYLVEYEPDMIANNFVYTVGAYKPENGMWQWLDGQPVDPTSYIWHPGFPDDITMAMCGQFQPSGANNRLYLSYQHTTSQGPSWICQATPLTSF